MTQTAGAGSGAADLHHSIDHVVARFFEGSDGLVSSAARVLHDHVDVVGGDAGLVLGGLVGGGGLAGGGLGRLRTGGGLGHLLLLGHLGGLSLGHALVGVVVLELTEADKLVAGVAGDEHLRVVDHEDEAVALLDGDAGDARELLHAELGEGLAALLLASVQLGAVYSHNIHKSVLVPPNAWYRIAAISPFWRASSASVANINLYLPWFSREGISSSSSCLTSADTSNKSLESVHSPKPSLYGPPWPIFWDLTLSLGFLGSHIVDW